MIVSATQIRLNGLIGFLRFTVLLFAIKKQLSQSSGLVKVEFRGFRTLTLWRNIESMKNFRNSAPHKNAMAQSVKIGQVKSLNWQVSAMPEWDEVKQKLDVIPFIGK